MADTSFQDAASTADECLACAALSVSANRHVSTALSYLQEIHGVESLRQQEKLVGQDLHLFERGHGYRMPLRRTKQ
jgi:hypothetical protein